MITINAINIVQFRYQIFASSYKDDRVSEGVEEWKCPEHNQYHLITIPAKPAQVNCHELDEASNVEYNESYRKHQDCYRHFTLQKGVLMESSLYTEYKKFEQGRMADTDSFLKSANSSDLTRTCLARLELSVQSPPRSL